MSDKPNDDVVVFKDCDPVDTSHGLDDPRYDGRVWVNGVLQPKGGAPEEVDADVIEVHNQKAPTEIHIHGVPYKLP
jgi:hypothetical protein